MDTNGPILEELVGLRHKKASLMGYPTHAAFIAEDRMSETAGKVGAFLSDLATQLKPLLQVLQAPMHPAHQSLPACGCVAPASVDRLSVLQSDLAAIQALKAADGEAGPIAGWDKAFYCKQLEETKYEVDHEVLKTYFPLEKVTEGLLDIYQELLGLTFTRAPELEKAAWHPEVVAYRVTNTEPPAGSLFGCCKTDDSLDSPPEAEGTADDGLVKTPAIPCHAILSIFFSRLELEESGSFRWASSTWICTRGTASTATPPASGYSPPVTGRQRTGRPCGSRQWLRLCAISRRRRRTSQRCSATPTSRRSFTSSGMVS